jgi:hypothetical protein
MTMSFRLGNLHWCLLGTDPPTQHGAAAIEEHCSARGFHLVGGKLNQTVFPGGDDMVRRPDAFDGGFEVDLECFFETIVSACLF